MQGGALQLAVVVAEVVQLHVPLRIQALVAAAELKHMEGSLQLQHLHLPILLGRLTRGFSQK